MSEDISVSRPTRVLIVDDDEEIRRSISEVLRERGHEVDLAADGREALDRLRSGVRPSVIILDLMMPVMNGWQLQSRLVDDPELAGIPTIVLTAMGPYWGVPEGASAHVRKPFDLNQLLREIDRCAA